MGILDRLFGAQEVLRVEVRVGSCMGRADFLTLVPFSRPRRQQLLVQATGLVYGQLHFSVFGSPDLHRRLLTDASRLAKYLGSQNTYDRFLLREGCTLAEGLVHDMMARWFATVVARRDGNLAIRSKPLKTDVLLAGDFLAYTVTSAVQQLDTTHVLQLAELLQGMNRYYERTRDFESMNSPSKALYYGLFGLVTNERPASGGEITAPDADVSRSTGEQATPEEGRDQVEATTPRVEDLRWSTSCPSCGDLLVFGGVETSRKTLQYIRANCTRCSLTKHFRMTPQVEGSKKGIDDEHQRLSCPACGYEVKAGELKKAVESGTGRNVILVEVKCRRCYNLRLLRFAADRTQSRTPPRVEAAETEKTPPRPVREPKHPVNSEEVSSDRAAREDEPHTTETEEFAGAIPVRSVMQEYIILATQACTDCGGSLEPETQHLKKDRRTGRPYDRIIARCRSCGRRESFLFEVSACFESYSE